MKGNKVSLNVQVYEEIVDDGIAHQSCPVTSTDMTTLYRSLRINGESLAMAMKTEFYASMIMSIVRKCISIHHYAYHFNSHF